MSTIQKTPFAGYEDCVEISNGTTTVVLGPHCGGRVLSYRLNGTEAIWLDPSQHGWVEGPDGDDSHIPGGRCDIGPEKVIPPHPILWKGPWRITSDESGPVVMESGYDGAVGVRLRRSFSLAEVGSELTFTQTIINESDSDKQWCHWGRTFTPHGGICVVPLSGWSRFPNGYVMYGNNDSILFKPEDPRIVIRDNFLFITGIPRFPKLGFDTQKGALGYFTPNGLLFKKEFPVYPERVYNEIAALTLCVYYPDRDFVELEPIGPADTIKPGTSTSFTEVWDLAQSPAPQSLEHVPIGLLKDMGF